jgi:hypothetical protein
MRFAYPLVAAAAAVALAAGCTSDVPDDAPAAATPSASPRPTGCAEPTMAPLPAWARAGFSGDARAVHVLGDRGDIVAVLFGHPLSQPPDARRSNKILWVSREPVEPGDELVIDATSGGTTAQRRVPGGPGPSIIDLPRAGCWELTLSWSGRQDTMRLRYAG